MVAHILKSVASFEFTLYPTEIMASNKNTIQDADGKYSDYIELYNSGVLDDMPAYPKEGSIIERDGIVIVKVSEDY